MPVHLARPNLRGQDHTARIGQCRSRTLALPGGVQEPRKILGGAASVKFFSSNLLKERPVPADAYIAGHLVTSDQRLRAHHRRAESVEGAEQQVGARMGRAGDSKTFLAVAAALMAGLVIATMLAINAKLQSALAPTVEQAGAPAIKMIPPAAAPLLQSTVAPSIANSVPNSGTNSFNNSTAATPHTVASPKLRAV